MVVAGCAGNSRECCFVRRVQLIVYLMEDGSLNSSIN